MNCVNLIGRLTRDPDVRYNPNTQIAVATFNLAIDRPTKNGEKQTDFPRVTVFGRTAENCEKYLKKGRLCGVQGRIQTGSYKNKNGETVYTTDVVAERVEFIDWGERRSDSERAAAAPLSEDQSCAPDGFRAIDDDIPF